MKIIPDIFRRTLILSAVLITVGCQSKHADATARNTYGIDAGAIPAASINKGPALVDLIGGDLGIGGGFLVAAAPEKIQQHQREQALLAAQKAEESPVTIGQVHKSESADLNGDGFITLDEILAMVRSGLTDRDVTERLQKTHYVFRLTPQQERYLSDRGVSQNVIAALRGLSGQEAESAASKVAIH